MDDDFVMMLIMMVIVILITAFIMFTPLTCAFCHEHKRLYHMTQFSVGGVQYNVCDDCRDNMVLQHVDKKESK